MKLEILNENQNNVLRRKELQVAIAHDNEPTPSKAALQELLAKQFGHEKEKIDIRSVYSDKGKARSLSKIFVWEALPPKKVKEAKEEKKVEGIKKTKEEGKEEKEVEKERKEVKTEVKKKEEKPESKEESKEKREKEEKIEAKAEKEEETKPVIEEQEETEAEEPKAE